MTDDYDPGSLDDPELSNTGDEWRDDFRSVEFEFDEGIGARARRLACRVRRWWYDDSPIAITFLCGVTVGAVSMLIGLAAAGMIK